MSAPLIELPVKGEHAAIFKVLDRPATASLFYFDFVSHW